MKRNSLGSGSWGAMLLALGFAAGCGGRMISPYDVDLDHGVQDFKLKLTTLVSDAAVKSGTPDGSFEAFRKGYSDLEIQLLTLRDRALILEAKDVSCSVPEAVQKLVVRFPEASAVMNGAPAASPASVPDNSPVPVSPLAIGRQKNLPPAVGCMTRLIDNIAGQLTSIESIHADPNQCLLVREQPTLTCFRKAAAAGALAAANHSLDAAQLVQVYKNEGGS